MTSSGTRTPARSSYDAWSSLDPDLLVIVAKNCDAASVCQLSQACKAWRGAVAANSSIIWEQLVSKRFPRSVDILRALPPMPKYSFAEHYREQLKAENTSTQRPKPLTVTTQLSDFIFTTELISTSGSRRIVDQWTSNVFHGEMKAKLTLSCRSTGDRGARLGVGLTHLDGPRP